LEHLFSEHSENDNHLLFGHAKYLLTMATIAWHGLKMSATDFFTEVKAGDVVGVSSRGPLRRAVVKRVTKTLIILSDGHKFRRQGGRCTTGSVLDHKWLVPWLDADQARHDASARVNRLMAYPWGRLDRETIRKICDLLPTGES
jgi:hypothetical protein